MLVAFASLYLLWPSLTEVFTLALALRDGARLVRRRPPCRGGELRRIWHLQRIALQTKSWYAVGTPSSPATRSAA